VVSQETPEDRREANRVVPPNGRAVGVLVVAKRQVHLAQVLAVRDGNHRIEAVGLMAASVTGLKSGSMNLQQTRQTPGPAATMFRIARS
jgi:hypothetical protein